MNIQELLNLFRSGKASAKSHMKNLIEMAAVDGNFDASEKMLLKVIARKNNISESQLQEIQANPDNVKFELPTNARDKFHQFYDLVHMMSVDQTIHPEEMKLCNLYAVRFGYKREKSNEIIEAIKSNIKYGREHDEAMKRVEMLIA